MTVTIDTPGIARQPFCCLPWCGKAGVVEQHHVIPRSRGGHHGPQVPLCRACHTRHHSVTALQFEYVDGTWYAGERGQHMRALVIADPQEAA
jgi:hypothetical protein